MDFLNNKNSTFNSIIEIKVISIQTSDKFYPVINALVTNKTNKIIKIKFNDVYFISHNKIQRDISNSYYLRQPIEILPNVSKNITYNLSDINDKDYRFNQNDLIISSFTIDGSKYSLGFRIGKAKNLSNVYVPKPIHPKKKNNGCFSGCFKSIGILFLIFIIIIILAIFINELR